MSETTPQRSRADTDGMPQRSERRDEGGASRLAWLVPVGALLILGAAYFLVPAVHDFAGTAWGTLTSGDKERVSRWVSGFGPWGPALILGVMMAQALVAVIPSTLVMVVAVLAYGPFFGGLLAWTGPMLAATLNYGIGRALGPATVDRMIGEKTEQKVERFVKRYGFWAIVLARAAPAISDDAFSFVAGIVKMPFLSYTLAGAVGVLPLAALIAFIGEDIERLKAGLLWGSLATAALFLAYVAYDHLRRGREGDEDEGPSEASQG